MTLGQQQSRNFPNNFRDKTIMIDKRMDIQMLGKAGEAIIRNFLVSHDYTVTDSVDQYDSEKDFIAVKKGITYTVEVKTQQPYVYRDMISFEEHQLAKCLTVDYLFFVVVPPVMQPSYKHSGKILFAKPLKDELEYELYQTKAGDRKVGFRIDQQALHHVASLTDSDLTALTRHTVSNYEKGYSLI